VNRGRGILLKVNTGSCGSRLGMEISLQVVDFVSIRLISRLLQLLLDLHSIAQNLTQQDRDPAPSPIHHCQDWL
jgi:hypothetical protein